MVREYINADGYRIKVSKKAYGLLYKKNGFVPVEAAAPARDMTEFAETSGKANKGKTKSTASKARKTTSVADQKILEDTGRDADGQEDADAVSTDQDAAEQPEGK